MTDIVKKKPGRPRKNILMEPDDVPVEKKENIVQEKKSDIWDWEISGNQRRDDLAVQMILGIIAKQGQIKYDFAKDIFNTATQLAYDFGWMERPKEKKTPVVAVFTPNAQVSSSSNEDVNEDYRSSGIITPADAFRAVRGES